MKQWTPAQRTAFEGISNFRAQPHAIWCPCLPRRDCVGFVLVQSGSSRCVVSTLWLLRKLAGEPDNDGRARLKLTIYLYGGSLVRALILARLSLALGC